MDDLLKAFAAKRRQDAGKSTLHPATRKMLQAEVQRTFKNPSAAGDEPRVTWRLLWPKLALSAAACALVIFGILRVRDDSPSRFAQSSDTAAKAAQQSAATAPAADAAETDAVAATRRGVPMGRAANESPPPAAAPATTRSRALNDELTVRQEKEVALKSETATITAAASSDAAVREARSTELAEPTPKRYFVESQLRTFGGNLSAEAAHRPLKTFQVEPMADRLRIIDSDGSVYEGPMTALVAGKSKDKDLSSRGAFVGDRVGGIAGVTPPSEDGLNFSFEVTGTNRTLNQPVRFAGVYSTRKEGIDSIKKGGDSFKTAQTAPADEEAKQKKADLGITTNTTNTTNTISPLPSTRISGTLFINTNEVPVNAVPAAP